MIDRIRPADIFLKVLDPSLIETLVHPNLPTKFADIDNRTLQHPPEAIPFCRILDFYAKLSFDRAINKGWIPASSDFDDFFDMSLGGSILDLYIYHDLLDSDEEADFDSREEFKISGNVEDENFEEEEGHKSKKQRKNLH